MCAQANVTFAYYYALAIQRTTNASTNLLFHQRNVSTAADKWLNKPNVNTLYSRAFLDLLCSDLVINVPEIEDCYWPYQAYINIPTPYAISAVRILVQPNEADAAAVHRVQDQFGITPIRRASQLPVAPSLNLTMFTDPKIVPGSINTLEEGVLRLTAKLSPYNAPLVIADRTWVSATLQGAGLAKGCFAQPKGTNLTAASQAANNSIVNEFFVHPQAAYIGNFQSAYVTRYNIAATGYLTRDQAMYPAYASSTINNIIPSTSALRLTFSAEPKLKSHGFWSLTIYDANAYLIPNDLDSNVPPPANWTSNWLPAPPDGNSFQINLRFYGGEDAMSNGSYVYPVVETIDAIPA
ncbi:hypothetical protein BGZ61DRAFT_500654 [Ilyonectria robusta]|uniref:uncharacterized protein n=1 Tax=Ilyonectria robusta TaxID=1079257 RepID=UPI001E8D76A5|nr:uncharacterized protein BGZ61DRAFT_500654 [Ilyonectria robusta]KAH8654162.1 hypothetical protein BGZ61DRAFT_500654 [Ilyonectria robusta]